MNLPWPPILKEPFFLWNSYGIFCLNLYWLLYTAWGDSLVNLTSTSSICVIVQETELSSDDAKMKKVKVLVFMSLIMQ